MVKIDSRKVFAQARRLARLPASFYFWTKIEHLLLQ
jgi:hypothetical protein